MPGWLDNDWNRPPRSWPWLLSWKPRRCWAAHVHRLDADIVALAQDCEATAVIHALMRFRGISVTTAFGLAVEIGDFTRFTGATIGAYLGLVPSEHSSGGSRSQGSITKACNSYARKMLIEAAWSHARTYSRPGTRLRKQLDKVDAATRIRAIEGNQRLHRVWRNFQARNKRSLKAITAVARELAGWCWSVAAPLQQPALASTTRQGSTMR